MKQITIIASILIFFILGIIIYKISSNETEEITQTNTSNISIIDGVQIIEISARGGYKPKNTIAQANIPTQLKIITNNTFDCSSALVIPDLEYQKNLPLSGETIVEIPLEKTSGKLQGLCSMGMYNFNITFKP